MAPKGVIMNFSLKRVANAEHSCSQKQEGREGGIYTVSVLRASLQSRGFGNRPYFRGCYNMNKTQFNSLNIPLGKAEFLQFCCMIERRLKLTKLGRCVFHIQ